MGKRNRSAKDGQFVTEDYARKHPTTTVSETIGGQPTHRSRDAGSGRFVSDEEANRRPTRTVTEDR